MIDNQQTKRQRIAKSPNVFAPQGKLVEEGEEFVIHGYQKFRVRPPDQVWPIGDSLQAKWDLIGNDIGYLVPDAEVMDLGCNAGFFSIQAALLGAKRVVAVEADTTYTQLLREVAQRLSLRPLEIVEGQVQSYRGERDVVLALALVHWLYSLTAELGPNLIRHLAGLARRALFVEWIDPQDHNITQFGHVEKADHPQYQRAWFLEQLQAHFPITILLGETASHREMFLGLKGRNNHSRIWIDRPNRVVVKSPTNYLEMGIVQREADWLKRLNHLPFVPRLLREGDVELSLEYVGQPLTRANCPGDAEEQGAHIVRVLRDLGCQHNDIRPENLTVHEGQIHLIDFAWATEYGTPSPPDWPDKIGAEYRCPDRLDDIYSMRRCLAAIRSSYF